jgi:hypothetical protein
MRRVLHALPETGMRCSDALDRWKLRLSGYPRPRGETYHSRQISLTGVIRLASRGSRNERKMFIWTHACADVSPCARAWRTGHHNWPGLAYSFTVIRLHVLQTQKLLECDAQDRENAVNHSYAPFRPRCDSQLLADLTRWRHCKSSSSLRMVSSSYSDMYTTPGDEISCQQSIRRLFEFGDYCSVILAIRVRSGHEVLRSKATKLER